MDALELPKRLEPEFESCEWDLEVWKLFNAKSEKEVDSMNDFVQYVAHPAEMSW